VGAVLLTGCSAGAGKPAENPGLRGVLGEAAEGFERVTGPRPLVWPDDHGAHPRHRSEWWYWTGDLRAADGRRFGYQVTVFRFALSATAPAPAPWVSNQAWMAHAALSDGAGNRFRSVERLQRGAMGLAGVTAPPFAVWCADVRAEGVGGTPELPVVRLTAPRIEDAGYDLVLEPTRPVLLQGDAGYSRKGQDPTNASTYYSFTRLRTRGTVTVAGEVIPVEGWSWFDREWSTSALDPGTVGWDWLSLHLRDGSDVMLYRLRTADGGQSLWSKGVLRRADGSRRDLGSADIAMTDLGRWRSPAGGSYPAGLRVRAADLDLTIRPLIPDQEWRTAFRYWEGLVDALGPDGAVLGSGYLEMTGH
jgi:predicted secreted hydrolase